MPYSEVQLANMALSRVGVTRQIQDLGEDSTEAAVCKLFYEPSRDAVLKDYPWPFASITLPLGKLPAQPPAPWSLVYRYPNDCIRAIAIAGGTTSTPIPFKVGHDASGLVIFTDQRNAELEYTKRFTDPTFFPADFASALAWRLAMEITVPLSISAALGERAETRYGRAILAARQGAANEGHADPPSPDDSEFIQARL